MDGFNLIKFEYETDIYCTRLPYDNTSSSEIIVDVRVRHASPRRDDTICHAVPIQT